MELPTALLAFSFFSAVFAADGPTQGSPASPAAAAITAPPSGFELRKRQGDRHYVCGYDPSGESVTCPNHDLTCAASIYPDAEAYVYCSTGGALLATVTTTAFANWDTATRCPSLAYCCYGDYPLVQTNHYIASGYTVTGFGCTTVNRVVTYNPATNVLDPPRYSTSLIQATASSSSSSAAASSTASSDDSSGGLSSGTKIGIGAGVGVGVGIVLLCAAIFFFRRHQQKKKKDKAANAFAASHGPYTETSQQPPHTPQPPYSPPVYQENQQFKQESASQEAYVAHKVQPEEYTAYKPESAGGYTAYRPSDGPAELASGSGPLELETNEMKPQELAAGPYTPKS